MPLLEASQKQWVVFFRDAAGRTGHKKTYPFFLEGLCWMTATVLLDELRTKGVQLTIEGEHLAVDAPKGVLTDELRQAIRTQKAALLALLTASSPDASSSPKPLSPMSPCVVCRRPERRDDAGVLRCVHCWSAPLTEAARHEEAAWQAALDT